MMEIQVEQNSDEWDRARLGIPTASDFSKILTGTGKPSSQVDEYAAYLAAEMYAGEKLGKGFKGSYDTRRGHELEEEAREIYAFTRDYEVETCGFIIEDEFDKRFGPSSPAGCSPDGYVKIPGRGQHPGLLEIKCLSAPTHVRALRYYAKNKRPEPTYVAQTQGQMLITHRTWVDLYFYHPELPELCIRIRKDEKYQALLVAQINKCTAIRDELLSVLREAA